MEFRTIKKQKEHPLEDFFNMESGQSITEYEEPIPVPAVVPEHYDPKDAEIEDQLQTVYEAAMGEYQNSSESAQNVEGKYKARNAEVAIQALNTALSAIKTRSDIKSGKDKLGVQRGSAGPKELTQNNIIVTDRNDLMKALANKRDGQEE